MRHNTCNRAGEVCVRRKQSVSRYKIQGVGIFKVRYDKNKVQWSGLSGAEFWAVLKDAKFSDCNLEAAEFDDVNFSGSSYENINLSNARFNNTNLSGVSFVSLNMSNVVINDVNIEGMKINGVLVTDLFDVYEKNK